MRNTALICLICASALPAAERQFTYTHSSAVLAPGQKEVEILTTMQGGREGSSYRRMDTRFELEVGVAPDLQAAVYLNHRRTSLNGVATSAFEGISLELKRRLSDPVADAFGSALYVEGTANASEVELEFKGIADWRSGPWTAAANATVEFEWAEKPIAAGNGANTIEEQKVKLTLATTYQFADGWSLGLEVENRNPIEQDRWQSSTLWAGPVVHMSNPHLWATLTILPQIANLGGVAKEGDRELSDNSRIETRLILGFNF